MRHRHLVTLLTTVLAGGPAPDTTPPTVAITSTESNPTFAATIPLTITFSEAVTGFVVGDITIAGCTLSGFAGSGAVYTVTATPTANTVTVDIAQDVCVDGAGNQNTAATQFVIVAAGFGLEFYIDLSDLATLFKDTARTDPVTTDADPIAGITDKSGNAKHATQTTLGNRPLYKANIKNGRSIARFDGTASYLLASINKTIKTAIFIGQCTDGATFTDYHRIVQGPLLLGNKTSANLTSGGELGAWRVNGVATASFAPLVNFKVATWYYSTGSASGATSAIGSDPTPTAGRYWPGDYSELMLYSTLLSAAEMTAIENAKMTKWGLP